MVVGVSCTERKVKKERKRKEQEEENIVRRVVYNDTNLMLDKR